MLCRVAREFDDAWLASGRLIKTFSLDLMVASTPSLLVLHARRVRTAFNYLSRST